MMLEAKIKKPGLIVMSILLSFLYIVLPGCKIGDSNKKQYDNNDKISICTSFYVMYDFAKKIGGDRAIVKNLLPAGSDPHSWEPSPKDVVSMEKADIFIYNGAGMEGWIEKVLSSIDNKALVTVETTKDIELHKIELDETHKGFEGQEDFYDPHVWLDPMKAKMQIRAITDALVQIDSDNKDYYEKNYENYANELEKLDDNYRKASESFRKKDVVVSHGAFGYLCNAYGLNQVAISGIDEELEPTSSRMMDVSRFIKDNSVSVIFFDKTATRKTVDIIAGSTGAKTGVLNPIASLTPEEIKSGKDYFSVMRENLKALEIALN